MFPNVVTRVSIPDSEFVLLVYAFRKLSAGEASVAAKSWLKENKRRTFPKSGTGKVITILGADDQV